MRRAISIISSWGLVAGCQGPISGPASGFGESLPEVTSGLESTSGGGPSTGGSSSSGPGGSEDDSAGSTTTGPAGPLHDVGYSQDLGSQGPPGCKGKIDFLFVVSRDAVMQTIQQRIIDAFASFHATIATEFDDFDYHIMVVDGDPEWGLVACNEDCASEYCGVEDYPCDMVETISSCDETLGAGTVFNAGWMAANEPCDMLQGRRYLSKGQPKLAETFACIAQLGVSGRDWLGAAMSAAVSPEMLGPGGCNEGFLRDDALLMVTFVMGGWDDISPGSPESWAKAVIDAKHGDASSIVMFGFFAPDCLEEEDDRLCQMMKLFPHSRVQDNTVENYGPAFTAATEMIGEACSEFIPK